MPKITTSSVCPLSLAANCVCESVDGWWGQFGLWTLFHTCGKCVELVPQMKQWLLCVCLSLRIVPEFCRLYWPRFSMTDVLVLCSPSCTCWCAALWDLLQGSPYSPYSLFFLATYSPPATAELSIQELFGQTIVVHTHDVTWPPSMGLSGGE